MATPEKTVDITKKKFFSNILPTLQKNTCVSFLNILQLHEKRTLAQVFSDEFKTFCRNSYTST